MKYCILRDHPIASISLGKEDNTSGCFIYNVWHKCKDCPNLMEMGDTVYTDFQITNK